MGFPEGQSARVLQRQRGQLRTRATRASSRRKGHNEYLNLPSDGFQILLYHVNNRCQLLKGGHAAAGLCRASFPREQNLYNDLYWSVGDGGPATDPFNTAQNLTNLHGTMIRISVPSFEGAAQLYQIPSGNYQGKLQTWVAVIACGGVAAVLLVVLMLLPFFSCVLNSRNRSRCWCSYRGEFGCL